MKDFLGVSTREREWSFTWDIATTIVSVRRDMILIHRQISWRERKSLKEKWKRFSTSLIGDEMEVKADKWSSSGGVAVWDKIDTWNRRKEKRISFDLHHWFIISNQWNWCCWPLADGKVLCSRETSIQLERRSRGAKQFVQIEGNDKRSLSDERNDALVRLSPLHLHGRYQIKDKSEVRSAKMEMDVDGISLQVETKMKRRRIYSVLSNASIVNLLPDGCLFVLPSRQLDLMPLHRSLAHHRWI